MGWLTAAGAVIGLGQGLINGFGQRDAAKEANKLAEKVSKKQFRRAMKEWRISRWEAKSNWLWQTAQVEALRYAERQKKADYEWRASQMIDAALQNLEINKGAIYDRFIVEEGLRARQAELDYGYKMNMLGLEAGEAARQAQANLADIGIQKQILGLDKQMLGLDKQSIAYDKEVLGIQDQMLGVERQRVAAGTLEQVRQYMQSIKDSALQSQEIVSRTARDSQELTSSLIFEAQKNQLQWEASQIATVMDKAEVAARSSARQGGSGSAARLAANEAQKLGRAWGEMEMLSRNRQSRVGMFNTAMKGEVATQLGRIALTMQDQAERMKYTSADSLLQMQGIDLKRGQLTLEEGKYDLQLGKLDLQMGQVDLRSSLLDIKAQDERGRASYAQQRSGISAAYETSVFNDLTRPSFDLAKRQGMRELQSLYIQTQSQIDEASMPYRESIIFDPLKPITGLRPEYLAPTKVYEPGVGGIIANSFISGAQGAINLGSYTKSDGTLGWR